ncbi:hypothetical protein [Prochlorococcus sp. MIT 1341]|uniref:hypothetical protein n=1 Tax=Prochlorococcus sp. MIT 1341 TaxID=3096221 RepID=UPI002A75CBF6|nr:hypothetical protein [Prochlorococcus sp. MIT 1341]
MVRVRERVKEILDFARAESPYRSANKGWITDDVFLEWGSPSKAELKQGDEVLDISVYWNPINQIILILFSVILLATILVFLAVSFTHGRLDFSSWSKGEIALNDVAQVEVISLKEKEQTPDFSPQDTLNEASLLANAGSIEIKASAPVEIVNADLKPLQEESLTVLKPTGISVAKPTMKTPARDLSQVTRVTAVDLFQTKKR